MPRVVEEREDGLAILTLNRPKVNAIDADLVAELRDKLIEHERSDAKALILTGSGSFFSFGWDVPHFRGTSRTEFTAFVHRFTELCTAIFVHPKPVVAAINGHAIAGGCMFALGCDYRVMTGGRARIGLNEIGFGASVFAGTTEMLRFATGSREASRILLSGALLSAEEARVRGMVDEVVSREDVLPAAKLAAFEMGRKSPRAFRSLKHLLRLPVADDIRRREEASVREFLDVWYSAESQASIARITIRESE